MEVTVSSMFTTTPRRKPCEGQVPTPTIFSFPSRSNSPTRTQIFVVPTSIPTITRSCTIHAPNGRLSGRLQDARALQLFSLRCFNRYPYYIHITQTNPRDMSYP